MKFASVSRVIVIFSYEMLTCFFAHIKIVQRNINQSNK